MSDEYPSAGPAGAAMASDASVQRARLSQEASQKARMHVALVEGMARGEQDALSRLYDETSPLVNGLLLRMLAQPQDAEEALLDVYMKAWRNAGTYSADRGSVQTWLVMMARSIAIDRIRRKRAEPKVSDAEFDAAVEIVSPAVSPEEQTVDSQRRTMLEAVMRELAPEQREVLELAFYGGFTHSELALQLRQPLGTVKTRIRTGLLRLKALLGEGVTS